MGPIGEFGYKGTKKSHKVQGISDKFAAAIIKNVKNLLLSLVTCHFFVPLYQLKTKNYGKEKRWKTTEQEAGGRNAADTISAESKRDILVQTDIQGFETRHASSQDACH
jgi:hypothetical protein